MTDFFSGISHCLTKKIICMVHPTMVAERLKSSTMFNQSWCAEDPGSNPARGSYKIITVWRPCNSSVPVWNWFLTSFQGREARAWDSYLACIGREGKESFERSAVQHRHLILWNGCSHSEHVFETNTLIPTLVRCLMMLDMCAFWLSSYFEMASSW